MAEVLEEDQWLYGDSIDAPPGEFTDENEAPTELQQSEPAYNEVCYLLILSNITLFCCPRP